MSVMTVTTTMTRQYLYRKSKDDLVDMILRLLDANAALEREVQSLTKQTTHDAVLLAGAALEHAAIAERLAELIVEANPDHDGHCGRCGRVRCGP